MTWFKILFEGDGLDVEGSDDRHIFWRIVKPKIARSISGFYATRYVEANDAECAIRLIEQDIRQNLFEFFGPQKDAFKGLVLKVDSVLVVTAEEVDRRAIGFTFF